MSVTKSSTVRRPGREPPHERERFLAPLPERGERLGGVVAEVLALLGPAVGGRGIERRELRLVHRHHLGEARHEQLLRVPEVADDFPGGPALRVGPAGQGGIALAAERGGQLVGRAPEARQAVGEGLLGVLVHGRHGENLR
ncbi:MAG: hypothetical protein HYS37_11000 [Candidatus Rokubacteria bacterium]|nr:hypothetical protein [Candidatus Rokubacteria bacterium]